MDPSNKCKECLATTKKMNHKTPVGWIPFGWSPQGEEPIHFYVFPADTPKPPPDSTQELEVVRLCEVPNPQDRR